ncbi:MAG: DMT family transporter [Pseudomonadota bacterium]
MTMTRKHALDQTAVIAMVILCALWGFQQVLIKWALPEIGPLWQSGVRSAGASVLIGLWIIFTVGNWREGLWRPGIVVGLLFAVEFGVLYVALQYTDASRAVLLLYTAPFVVAVGAHFLIRGEHLSRAGWAGVALAFVGTGIVLRTSLDFRSETAFGDLCALAAGIAWGFTTLTIRKTRLTDAPPSQTLFFQLLISGIVLCAGGALWEGSLTLPREAITYASLVYQTVIVAALSFLVWFALVTRYSVTKLSVFTFMAPLFGALAGVIFLGESLGPSHIVALFCIMAGIIIVNRFGHARIAKEVAP